VEKEAELEKLRKEVNGLRSQVSQLTRTIDDLKAHVNEGRYAANDSRIQQEGYRIFDDPNNCLSQDISWSRLVNLLSGNTPGLTAEEAAKRWGKSRSRTSEVLNKLVDEGHLVKYRDGRRIKFRALDE
jgi:polyhydroxyalkanoate synthesis regulator phasin